MAGPLERWVRLALRVGIGASAKVVAELEGRRFKGDGARERVRAAEGPGWGGLACLFPVTGKRDADEVSKR